MNRTGSVPPLNIEQSLDGIARHEMSFRLRLGPFTFGSTGVRLSLWRRGGGVSVPITGKGRSFGKVGLGPFSWYFNGSSRTKAIGMAVGILVVVAIVGLIFSLG